MPLPSAKEKADGSTWEVNRVGGDAGSACSATGCYTIEYLAVCEDGARPVASPMLFSDKGTALASANALLRGGFDVLKVVGPAFEMGGTVLANYLRSHWYK